MAFPATILGMLSRPALSAFALLKAIKMAFVNRRIMGQLGQLDDHMLRDIGITRHDIASVAAEPLFRDPTAQLALRAFDGRLAARAAARERLAVAALLDGWDGTKRAA